MMAMTDDETSLVRDVGRRIAELRASKKLTQGKFAELLGIELRNVQRLERGTNLTLLTLSEVARALGVRPIELFEPPESRVVRRGRPRRADHERPVALPEAGDEGGEARGDGLPSANLAESAAGSRTVGGYEHGAVGGASGASPSEPGSPLGGEEADWKAAFRSWERQMSLSPSADDSSGHSAGSEAAQNLFKLSAAMLRISLPASIAERRWQDAALFARRLMTFLPGIAEALESDGPSPRRDILVQQMEGMRAEFYSEKTWVSVVRTAIIRGIQLVTEHRVPDVLAVARRELESEDLAAFDQILAVFRDPLSCVDAYVREFSSYYADLLLQQPALLQEAIVTWPAGPGRSSQRSKWEVLAELFGAIGIGGSSAKSIGHDWSVSGARVSSAQNLPGPAAVNAHLRREVWSQLERKLLLAGIVDCTAGGLEGIWVGLARGDSA